MHCFHLHCQLAVNLVPGEASSPVLSPKGLHRLRPWAEERGFSLVIQSLQRPAKPCVLDGWGDVLC